MYAIRSYYVLLFSLFSTAIMFYLLGLFLAEPALAQALGTSAPSFHIGVIAFGILFTPVSMVSGLLANVFSRRFEYQADDFAGNLTGGKPLRITSYNVCYTKLLRDLMIISFPQGHF